MKIRSDLETKIGSEKLDRWSLKVNSENNFSGPATKNLRDRKSTYKFSTHKLFGPHPKHPILDPQKKVYVPHFLGMDAKKGTNINFLGGILAQTGGPKRGIFGYKEFSSLSFPALKITGIPVR